MTGCADDPEFAFNLEQNGLSFASVNKTGRTPHLMLFFLNVDFPSSLHCT